MGSLLRNLVLRASPDGSIRMEHEPCREIWSGIETLQEAHDIAVYHLGRCPASACSCRDCSDRNT